MNKKTILLLVIILGNGFLNCKKGSNDSTISNSVENKAQTNSSSQFVKLVMADGGLNIRETPRLDGKIVFLIPKYSLLDMIETVGEEVTVKDKKGKWMNVRFGDKSGYVYGAYLTNAILEESRESPEGNYYYTFFSLPDYGSEDPSDCRVNYMQSGCLVVVYKTGTGQIVNAFTDIVVQEWLDKNQLAATWSIGDAGYGGQGVKALNIFTKAETDIWKQELQMKIGEEDSTQESESICLKTYCFDLKKNPDVISQIKSTRGLKFYSSGTYNENTKSYSTQISIGENKSILFIPEKNIVIEN